MTGLRREIVTEIQEADQISLQLVRSIYSEQELKYKNSDTYNAQYLSTIIFIFQDHQPVGRAALYLNPYINWLGEKTILVGNYECVNDEKIAKYLMEGIMEFASTQQCNQVLGPMNGSTWDSYRFPLQFDTPPFFTEDYFPSWYTEQFVQNGFIPVAGYYSHCQNDLKELVGERDREIEKKFKVKGVHIREISIENFESDITGIYELSAKAFAGNLFYSPVGLDYFKKKYLPVKNLIDPDFVLLAFNTMNDLVAFIFCVPDFYNNNGKTLVVKTIARDKDHAYAGISQWLFPEIAERAWKKGYSKIINAFMHEENISATLSSKFKSVPFRTYQLFAKTIKPG